MSILGWFRRDAADSPESDDEYTPFSSMFRNILEQLSNAVEEDKEEYPEDSDDMDAFLKVLRYQCKNRYSRQNRNDRQPLDAEGRFFLSKDRMKAYACLLPPDRGGADIDMDGFLADLRYEGICHGILRERAERYVRQKQYLHIFPVALGTPPRHSRSGKIKELFPRRDMTQLEVPADSIIDFGRYDQFQMIRKGEVICQIQQPSVSADGVDVTGKVLASLQGETFRIPMGDYTELTPDGCALVASIDGVLLVKNGRFCVRPQMVIPGNIDNFIGTLRSSGDLYISGNVSGGVSIAADGNIIITGEVRDAHIVCSGSIRVQDGVHGAAEKTFFQVGRQFQAPTIEYAEITTGSDLIAEMIMDSQIVCNGLLNVQGGRGLIVGGNVQASSQIICKRLGNVSGRENRVTVGSLAEQLSEEKHLQDELDSVRATLELLHKNIGYLIMAGTHVSIEQRKLLVTLKEQRTLYEEQEKNLQEKKAALSAAMDTAATTSKIICQEMYPVTFVQIGQKTMQFRKAETECNIHLFNGQIVVR